MFFIFLNLSQYFDRYTSVHKMLAISMFALYVECCLIMIFVFYCGQISFIVVYFLIYFFSFCLVYFWLS